MSENAISNTTSKAMSPNFKPNTKAPYSRTDLQHYLTTAINEKLASLGMPKDASHDRRLMRALGALAADYMIKEGCKDAAFVGSLLITGLQKEYSARLAKVAKEEFKTKAAPPPPYLTAIDGGLDDGEGDDTDDGDEDGEPEE